MTSLGTHKSPVPAGTRFRQEDLTFPSKSETHLTVIFDQKFMIPLHVQTAAF